MPARLAYFGISNNGVNLAINLFGLFLIIVWLSLLYWTRADAKRRIADPVLRLCATACSLFPFVGTIVYMIVRPPEYLEDIRERELEMQASEARLAQLSYLACQNCGREVEKDFLICPTLPQPPARAVRPLPAAARDVLERVPVLRDGGRRRRAAEPAPPRGVRRRDAARVLS